MADDQTTDQAILQRIQDLVAEEHRLQSLSPAEQGTRLRDVQVEIDQCWDLMRQRRALRAAGQDPAKAQVRPKEVVEKYEQ